MVVVRTSRSPGELVAAITAAVTPLLPAGSGPPNVTVMDDLYRELTADRRFAAALMGTFGVLALLIGAGGIYSVMSSIVAQQTREIGIRTALGATRSRIAAVVLSDAVRQVAIGLVIGLAVAWAFSGAVSSLLFGVRATDPALYGLVAAMLALTGIAAAWVPARRASRVDPIVALKE
jgi:ABC-type antimicrobial peptide transport system permease subunit